MKIIRNDKLINRNAKIGQYTNLAGIILLGLAMFLAVRSFNTTPTVTETYLLFGIMIVALILTQVSMFFGNRFGRKPRPDESLDAALKGIPGEYSLYHYASPVSHLLLGPAGLWILMPYHQKGKAIYKKNRWKGSGGGFLQGYMRIFGQESLGRPDLEAASEIAVLEKFFKQNLTEGETPPTINTALVFLDPDIQIEADESPLPAMQAKKLKEFIRKMSKDQPFSPAEVETVKALLEKE
jgi:hypothetical protein